MMPAPPTQGVRPDAGPGRVQADGENKQWLGPKMRLKKPKLPA